MIRFIQVSKVRELLRGNKFQIKKECFPEIDRIFGELLESLIMGAQSEDIKSIGIDDVRRLISTKKKSSDVLANNSSCKRCATLKEPFLKFAKQLQVFTVEEAKIMASKYY